MTLFDYIKEDVQRYLTPPQRKKKNKTLRMILTTFDREELWAIITYRFGRWVLKDFHVPIAKKLLLYSYDLLAKVNRLLTGINIWVSADIGKGFYIGHYPVIIGPVKMGDYCNVSANCVLGLGGRENQRGAPKFGDRVFIGPGAMIFGKITIGNNVAIGANAVVTKDLPDNAVVTGNPAYIINYNGSVGYIDLLDESHYTET